MGPRVIAALYVQTDGVYFDLPGADPWDVERDARTYAGPWPVVAHPPCKRWGRYWSGGPSAKVRRIKGDDGGCFSAALASVRKWGGVLEHPEASHAWWHHNLNKPPKTGGWIAADLFSDGWTCCVEQGHYGHQARKATWLYAVRVELPTLIWGKAPGKMRLDDGHHGGERQRHKRIHGRSLAATPPAFRDILVAMAYTATTEPEARKRSGLHASTDRRSDARED